MKNLLIIPIALLLCCTVANAQSTIPIQNPSFEAITSTGTCASGAPSYTVPGWTLAGNTASHWGGTIEWTSQTPPDGKCVAYAKGETITQDLEVTPQFGVYTLTFYVANWYYAYPGDYSATISIGPTKICSTYGWAIGDFTKVTLTCPISNYISDGYTATKAWGFYPPTQHVILSLSNFIGWQILFDNVSLSFTPGS